MKREAFVMLLCAVVLTSRDALPCRGDTSTLPTERETQEITSVHVGTPSGWFLEILPDGSAQVGFGSHTVDFAIVPSGTFDFRRTCEKLEDVHIAEGNMRSHFTVSFRHPGGMSSVSRYFSDSGLASALFAKAVEALDSPETDAHAQLSDRVRELYRTKPPVPHGMDETGSSHRYETQRGHFDYERRSPLDFLEYLKLKRQELTGVGVGWVTVWSGHDEWIEREHLPMLADLLGSEESCAAVVSAWSSMLPWTVSTVGREAAFLMEGFRQGRYPPGLHSGAVNIASVKAWWQAYGVDTSPDQIPFLRVYADGQLPVENVRVAITNPYRDRAILVTSVEFDGQLPELRYFYHGVYGNIQREGANFVHRLLAQRLSLPIGTCFLLPRQSTSWQRPMRVLSGGYRAHLAWREMPCECIATSVWFRSGPIGPGRETYEPLSNDMTTSYNNRTAAMGGAPPVIIEGEFPARSCGIPAPCVIARPHDLDRERERYHLPKGAVRYHLPILGVDSLLVQDEKVTFVKYSQMREALDPLVAPDIAPTVVNFLFLYSRHSEETIPCILSCDVFGDLIEVRKPSTNMYYDPGITPVALKTFPRIFGRAGERELPVVLRRIDSNSLGRRHVLVIGVEVDDRGRRIDEDGVISSRP